MRNLFILLSVSALSFSLTGCAVGQGDDTGSAAAAFESANGLAANGLAANGLAANGLAANGLAANGLAANGLAANGLAANGLAALQDPSPDGDLFRQVVKYTVSCALPPSATFDFSWTDASNVEHDESFPGALNLAPQWADGPLDETGQRIVSACLASRTNYFGVHVEISMRSSFYAIESQTPESELQAYPYVEGTFWGNLFAPTPYLNTCYNARDVQHSRNAQRDCASGYPEGNGQVNPCGMIAIQGSCSNVCGTLYENDGFYMHCVDRPGSGDPSTTRLVITTALP